MDLTLSSFISSVMDNPMLLITVLLTLGVVFVNGWTYSAKYVADVTKSVIMKNS